MLRGSISFVMYILNVVLDEKVLDMETGFQAFKTVILLCTWQCYSENEYFSDCKPHGNQCNILLILVGYTPRNVYTVYLSNHVTSVDYVIFPFSSYLHKLTEITLHFF